MSDKFSILAVKRFKQATEWTQNVGMDSDLTEEFLEIVQSLRKYELGQEHYQRPTLKLMNFMRENRFEHTDISGKGVNLIAYIAMHHDWEGIEWAKRVGLNINAVSTSGIGAAVGVMMLKKPSRSLVKVNEDIVGGIIKIQQLGAMVDPRVDPCNEKYIDIDRAAGPLHHAVGDLMPERVEAWLSGSVSSEDINRPSGYGRAIEGLVFANDDDEMTPNGIKIGLLLIEKGARLDLELSDVREQNEVYTSLRDYLTKRASCWSVLVEASDAMNLKKDLTKRLIKNVEKSDIGCVEPGSRLRV